MKLYRVHLYDSVEGSQGFEWTTTKRAAEATVARFRRDYSDADKYDPEPEIETIEIRPTRAGLLSALRLYASHPDNG